MSSTLVPVVKKDQWVKAQKLVEKSLFKLTYKMDNSIIVPSEGLLTKLEGRGYRARQFSDEALLQATEVRGVLEGLAAQRLAHTGLSSLNRERLDKSVEATSAVINTGLKRAIAPRIIE